MKPFRDETNSVGTAQCASELLDLVPAIMQLIRVQMRGAARAELSVPQFRTLGFLTRHTGKSISDLAEHIGLSLPSASKIVQSLLELGYLRRAVDPTDRRRTILAPTQKGQRVINRARAIARDVLSDHMTSLDEENRRSLAASLKMLRTVFIPVEPATQEPPRTRMTR